MPRSKAETIESSPGRLRPRLSNRTVVHVSSGDLELILPKSLGGDRVVLPEAIMGSYTRIWKGSSFVIEDIWLCLPPLVLPKANIQIPERFFLRQAIGSFRDAHVTRFGQPNCGSFDQGRQEIRECLACEALLPALGDGDNPRILLSKIETGYLRVTHASLAWSATGVVSEGLLEGTRIRARSSAGKGEDRAFKVCHPRRISTGFGTRVTNFLSMPRGGADVRISNLSGAGGVVVHCKTKGNVALTIEWEDAGGAKHQKTVTIKCE